LGAHAVAFGIHVHEVDQPVPVCLDDRVPVDHAQVRAREILLGQDQIERGEGRLFQSQAPDVRPDDAALRAGHAHHPPDGSPEALGA
jgi:hypothetical protein